MSDKKEYARFRVGNTENTDRPVGTGMNCYLCKNSTNHRVCRAFDKIPDDIWLGKVAHTSPYPGDNGIQFEAME